MPGSARSSASLARKMSAVALDHGFGAGVQVAGAGVIAEAGPDAQHILEFRRGKRAHIGPAFEESRVVRRDGPDGRLLQHDLGQPDVIRVRALARRRAPRQLAAMAVVPGEQDGGLR